VAHALLSITRVLARELGPRKIRINAIAPDGVETESIHRIGIIRSDIEKQMVSNTPLGSEQGVVLSNLAYLSNCQDFKK
jgi:NAD(P)-dependent dehydrogenase (short-subunit alcohol dehydrogenase family)